MTVKPISAKTTTPPSLERRQRSMRASKNLQTRYDTSTKCRDTIGTRKNIQLAIRAYRKGETSSMSAMAEKYGVPYSTLRDRLNGAQDRQSSHEPMQLFTKQEEKAMVRWCNHLDDRGFPPKLALVKQMAGCLIQKRGGEQKLGKH